MVIINGHATIAIAPYLSLMLLLSSKQASKQAATTTMNDVGSRTQRALSTAAAASDAENLTVVVLTPVIMAKYYSIAISNRQQG